MQGKPERTPYPFPPEGPSFQTFPAEIPWDTEIHKLSNWWLGITCECGLSHMPLRLLSARIGWHHSLRGVVGRLRCDKCGKRPGQVELESDPAGDVGRGGVPTQRHTLIPQVRG